MWNCIAYDHEQTDVKYFFFQKITIIKHVPQKLESQ